MKRKYANDKITVFWDSDKCMHSGICFGSLLTVFDPGKRPWVNLEGAEAETIKSTIDQCPSRALSYKVDNENNPAV